MNSRDKYQSSSREETPYTIYKTIQDDMMLKWEYLLPIYRRYWCTITTNKPTIRPQAYITNM